MQERSPAFARNVHRIGRAPVLMGRKLGAIAGSDEKVHFDEKSFRFALNEDAMATEKTAEGIRKFSADIVKLEKIIASKL